MSRSNTSTIRASAWLFASSDSAGTRVRYLLRQGLQVVVVCVLVAAMLTLLRGQSFWAGLVYSEAIGICSWTATVTGRLLLPRDAGDGWPRGTALPALMAAGIVVGFVVGTAIADALLGHSTWHLRPSLLAGEIASDAVIGGLVAGYFLLRSRAQKHRELAAAATHEATLARLSLLQSQLEPHMLFNTLANLRALIAVDPPRAEAMLDRLIDFLRATLAASRTPMHPLRDEFARLADYLALMQVRMGERLSTSTILPPALAAIEVPPLLLQPLVENAIKHGLEPQRGPGTLAVTAEIEGGALVLAVVDGGRGLEAAAAANAREPAGPSGGFGLVQVRERLHTLYGDAASLTVTANAAGPGTRAEIRLPHP